MDEVLSVLAVDSRSMEEDVPEQHNGEKRSLDSEGDAQDVVTAEIAVDSNSSVDSSAALKAVVEAAIYITDEPLTPDQIAAALQQPVERIKQLLMELSAEYAAPDRGLSIREVAGGYKMATKPEHHDSIRKFVNKLQPPLKLSLAALETLSVIAYKQPITGPEILDIRGVQGAGVLKTLLDRKLIAAAGRKNVLGKPILYKTTREFLVQFGLNSLAELPTLKEFEELGRFALGEGEEIGSSESQTVGVEETARKNEGELSAAPAQPEVETSPEVAENGSDREDA